LAYAACDTVSDAPLAEGQFGLDDHVLKIERVLRRLCGEGVHVRAGADRLLAHDERTAEGALG
jgi:hypothetical protein